MKDIRVKEIMTSPAVSVKLNTTLREVIKVLDRNHISGMPVVDGEGKVAGIISERDVLKYTRWVVGTPLRDPGKLLGKESNAASISGERGVDVIEAVASTTAGVVMTDRVITVDEDAPVLEVVRMMNSYQINRVPVVDQGGILRGLVSRADILRVVEKWADEK